MTPYVLVLILGIYDGGGITVAPHPYANKEACEVAGKAFASVDPRGASYLRPIYVCIPQGTAQ